jgi:hypothetical protein
MAKPFGFPGKHGGSSKRQTTMTKNHQAERDVGRPVADRPRCLASADQV